MADLQTPDSGVTEMPRYRCYKEVWALKIKSITRNGEPATDEQGLDSAAGILTPEDERYAPFQVPADYIFRHRPYAGGYYVVYKDGYKSFSPAEAFEDGYALIERQP